ncbi:MAG: amino acid ABC transporter permease [Anaerolineales bacterium]
MASDMTPGPQAGVPQEKEATRRGRMGLTLSWDSIPWWGVIILMVGVIVGYSMLTNSRYLDALYFIFDLPWNREAISRGDVGPDGEWTLDIQIPLETGSYSLFAQYLDETNDPIGRSPALQVIVPPDAPAVPAERPIPMQERSVEIDTSTPSFTGPSGQAARVILYDDFSRDPWRIFKRMVLSRGVFLTIRVTLISFVGALIIGLLFGLMRIAAPSPDLSEGVLRRLLVGLGLIALILFLVPSTREMPTLIYLILGAEMLMFLIPALPYTISTLYVELIRGIPMLVIVLYMGFAITPAVRNASSGWGMGEIDLRGLPAAIIGLSFGYGAYLAEVYRAGIQSIPRGQLEAARSLGMSYFQAMRHVILPQAIRVILPPLGNDFIALLKDSSLISVIALPETLQQGRLWISRNFRAFEGYNSVAMMYLIMTLMLSLLVRMIEHRAAIED